MRHWLYTQKSILPHTLSARKEPYFSWQSKLRTRARSVFFLRVAEIRRLIHLLREPEESRERAVVVVALPPALSRSQTLPLGAPWASSAVFARACAFVYPIGRGASAFRGAVGSA